VPQGSVLGPVLFCIYIRDAPQLFRKSLSQLYADDIAFYIAARSCQVVIDGLQEDLLNLDSYLTTKGLMLNPTKTKFLVLRRPNRQIPANVKLSCRGVDIRPCSSARYLGLIIDEHLTFSEHVEHTCRVVNQKVGAFRHGRRNLSKASRRIFYLSIIQSSLEYASTAYIHSLRQPLYNQLITTSKIALKKVFSLHRFTSRSSGPHTNAMTRGQTSAALVLPHPTSRFGFHAIPYLAADRWNTLPPECRQANSPAHFASLVKGHLGYPVKRH